MNLPCKECPVLAVCIIKLKQWIHPPDFTYFADVVECDRANDYIRHLTFSYSGNRKTKINEARELFRIPTLPRKHLSPFYAMIEVRREDRHMTDYITHNSDCAIYKMKLSTREKDAPM